MKTRNTDNASITTESVALSVQAAVEQLPNTIQTILSNYSGQTPLHQSLAFLPTDVVTDLQQAIALTDEALGLMLLPVAAAFSVTPISHFQVGAVAFDCAGNAYLGANFEFADTHIGQTIHAEQSAIAHAWSRGARALDLLVINYAPCGHCRQFINEVARSEDFRIRLPDHAACALSDYLPSAFGPADLGINERLLSASGVGLDETTANALAQLMTTDKVAEAAKTACANAYAPYSGSCSGIALQYADETVVGSYAENAAFNPTLPPLQVALNRRRLNGKAWQTIERAVMVEVQSTLSQYSNTAALLNSLGFPADSALQHITVTAD